MWRKRKGGKKKTEKKTEENKKEEEGEEMRRGEGGKEEEDDDEDGVLTWKETAIVLSEQKKIENEKRDMVVSAGKEKEIKMKQVSFNLFNYDRHKRSIGNYCRLHLH